MSFFSIGKNEIKELEKQKKHLESKINSDNRTFAGSGNVSSFTEIVLKNKRKKLSDKISLLKYMNPDDNDDCTA